MKDIYHEAREAQMSIEKCGVFMNVNNVNRVVYE